MKIDRIFEDTLYSFRYVNEELNEFDRLLDLWTDILYLTTFAKENGEKDITRFVNEIIADTNEIIDWLNELDYYQIKLDQYFVPLFNTEMRVKTLSFRKGKIKKNRLRLYAIRIDENCFVITGGAIKMSQTMQEHPDTAKELEKFDKAKAYLVANNVFDDSSFYELINE